MKISACKLIVEHFPDVWPGWSQLTNLYASNNQHQDTIRAAQQSLKGPNPPTTVYEKLHTAYGRLDQWDTVKENAIKHLILEPTNLTSLYALRSSFFHLQDYQNSLDIDFEIIRSHGTGGYTDFPVSYLFARSTSKIAIFPEALDLDETVHGESLQNFYFKSRLQGFDAQRKANWSLFRESLPNSPMAALVDAAILFRQSKFEQALELLQSDTFDGEMASHVRASKLELRQKLAEASVSNKPSETTT
jgi:hypothetical protein